MKRKKTLYMRRSCLTDKVVWLHWAASLGSKRWYYHMAWKNEEKLARKWKKREERRKKVILHILEECLADIPIMQPMTQEQRDAAKRLQALAEENIPFYRGFLDHEREERRRRNKHLKMIRERREREVAAKNEEMKE